MLAVRNFSLYLAGFFLVLFEILGKQANEKWWKGKIVTQILPAGEWWDAEAYHQKYLDVNPGGYECPSHFLRSFPPLS